MGDNKTGLGSAGCGCGGGAGGVGGSPLTATIGGGAWRTAKIQDVASYSPVIALARARNLPFAPYMINIRANFTDPSVTTLPMTSFEGSNERLAMTSICDSIVLQVTSPTLNAGFPLKYVNDWFFARQSGIEAFMFVDGAPRYTIAPFQTPIASLISALAEAWPLGWVVEYTQSVKMQFVITSPLPDLPVNVVCTFRFWQPYSDIAFAGMDNLTALRELQRLGYCAGWDYTNGVLLTPGPNGSA
jgi:hypothetical protein